MIRIDLGRRGFLGLAGGAALPALLVDSPGIRGPFPEYPFRLGVASGDPLPDGFVLWTRLAPEPLEPDGGMRRRRVPVQWEVATDERMRRVVRRGTAMATPQWAHSVHVELEDLQPGREYYYRFRAGGEISPVGRTKTAPAPDARLAAMAFAYVSCQSYPYGYYTAYDHIAREDIELVVHLGDYIYEGSGQGDLGRGHVPNKEITTLDDYRIRYGQYKQDPLLRAAHATHPFVVVHDDHDVDNNWADGYDGERETGAAWFARRDAAFQAYYENLPLRTRSRPADSRMRLYRRLAYGDLVEFNVLDTRQYKDLPACGGGITADCDDRLDPDRTILGDEQEAWLLDGLGRSRARWNVVAQQLLMAQRDRDAGEEPLVNMEQWDGYVADRRRLLEFFGSGRVANPIVITGDAHHTYVNELRPDYSDPDSPVVSTEFIGTSVCSFGDGSDLPPWAVEAMDLNPHMKFINDLRGYLRVTADRDQLRAGPACVAPRDAAGRGGLHPGLVRGRGREARRGDRLRVTRLPRGLPENPDITGARGGAGAANGGPTRQTERVSRTPDI